jgi:hypothetical protein
MRHLIIPRLLLALALLCSAGLAPAREEMAIFDVTHRPAEDLLPQVRTLLGKDGSVSVFGNRLVVRAPEKRLADVRWLLGELDRAPRRLLVEVRVDRERAQRRDDAQIRLRDLDADVRFHRYSTRGGQDILQRVHTLDGRPALIQVGQSVPVYEVEHWRNSDGSSQDRVGVRYKELNTGIYVLPRTHGNSVTLEVFQQAEAVAGVHTGHFEHQQADTVVSGRLGEWLPIGSLDISGRSHGSGIGYRAATGMAQQRYLSARVIPDGAP